jgi:DNA polymerase-3 subunit delta
VSPDQFLSQLKKQDPAPAYLFVGAEPYRRQLCRRALLLKVLPGGEREHGLSEFDLRETGWSAIADDARSLSLFAARRVIWITEAEAALPRGRSAASEAGDGGASPVAPLLEYLKEPSPGVVLVLDANRWDLAGDDSSKVERLRKLYSGVPAQVEFAAFSPGEARRLAVDLSKAAGLELDRAALDLLVDALGADGMCIATEIEKLALYAPAGCKLGAAELAALVPDSSVSTIFVLVDALGRRDRLRALGLVDTLLRQGEYMPLALNFLAGLFRLALAAKEKKLGSAQQVQHAFSKPGRPVWRSKAEQIQQAAAALTKSELAEILEKIFATDRALRSTRPDDRIVMEQFILGIGTSD